MMLIRFTLRIPRILGRSHLRIGFLEKPEPPNRGRRDAGNFQLAAVLAGRIIRQRALMRHSQQHSAANSIWFAERRFTRSSTQLPGVSGSRVTSLVPSLPKGQPAEEERLISPS